MGKYSLDACMFCSRQTVYVNITQFAGVHTYCEECAKASDEFVELTDYKMYKEYLDKFKNKEKQKLAQRAKQLLSNPELRKAILKELKWK